MLQVKFPVYSTSKPIDERYNVQSLRFIYSQRCVDVCVCVAVEYTLHIYYVGCHLETNNAHNNNKKQQFRHRTKLRQACRVPCTLAISMNELCRKCLEIGKFPNSHIIGCHTHTHTHCQWWCRCRCCSCILRSSLDTITCLLANG